MILALFFPPKRFPQLKRIERRLIHVANELEALKSEVSRASDLVVEAVAAIKAGGIDGAALVAVTEQLKASNDALAAALPAAPPAPAPVP